MQDIRGLVELDSWLTHLECHVIENAGNFRPHFDCDGRGWMRLFSRVFANTDSVLPDLGGFANVHTVPNAMAQPAVTYLPFPTATAPYPTATP